MASKENIYFLRSFLLLIEGGLYISKEILSRECQKSENDLDELLKINERKLKHLFHDKQYKKLFPEFGKADINSWDLQLSVGVLINVFGKYLKSGEKVKLKLLRDIRNDIYMHCTTAALDESKYEDLREDLDDIITTLASTFDISVQQRCSNCITQFTTGPLDAVRPSSQTLNGLSQSCQKKIKVGVETELVIGGPSTNWIRLCEHTLDTILNHAESMASKDGGFQEIEENVKKMLSYLECNKAAVFKGSKMKCIILYFECKDYESFLSFLDKVESQDYTCYLCDLSNSLHSFFKPSYPISITSKVTSESLQSVLIDIIKTFSDEKEEQRHVVEITSEENIHEKKAMAMVSRDVNKGTKSINQSETSLFLNFELKSEEALPQMLQSCQGKQFSDSLSKVAGSLSRHHGAEITLKTTMNVGAMLEALEESVSKEVTVDKETKNSESIYAKALKEDEFFSLSESPIIAEKVRIIKAFPFLREELSREDILHVLSRNGLLIPNELGHFGFTRKRSCDIFISMVLAGPKELLTGFKTFVHDEERVHIRETIERQSVSFKDITALSKLEKSMSGMCLRPNGVKPLIKFTSYQRQFLLENLGYADDVAAYLLSMMIISVEEFSGIIHQTQARKGVTVLLDVLEKCSEKHLFDFYYVLKMNGFPTVAAKLAESCHLKEECMDYESTGTTAKKRKIQGDDMSTNTMECKYEFSESIKLDIRTVENSIVNEIQKDPCEILDFKSLGLEITKVEKGSVLIELFPKYPEAWLLMQANCRSSKIKDIIATMYEKEAIKELLAEGEYRIKFRIYTKFLESENKERSRVIFHLEMLQQLSKEIVIENVHSSMSNDKRNKQIQTKNEVKKTDFIEKEMHSQYHDQKRSKDKPCGLNTSPTETTEIYPAADISETRYTTLKNKQAMELFFAGTIVLNVKNVDVVSQNGRKNTTRKEITCPKILNPVCYFP